jgi:phage terminase large subunit
LDNEGIPDAVLNNLMQRKAKAEAEERNGTKGYWWNWWQVYGLGEVGMLQEAVYPRWEILSERPERFTRFVYGLDFGFQHPTALVKVWFWEDELFIEEVIYKSGLTSNALIEEMRKKEVSREVEIMCDYARPEMIEDLDNAGFYVLKADKSVDAGINFLNQMKVYVHADSINIQRENRLYKRKVMNGIISEQIDKKNDDAMDAARYAAMEIKSAFYGGSAYESF